MTISELHTMYMIWSEVSYWLLNLLQILGGFLIGAAWEDWRSKRRKSRDG